MTHAVLLGLGVLLGLYGIAFVQQILAIRSVATRMQQRTEAEDGSASQTEPDFEARPDDATGADALQDHRCHGRDRDGIGFLRPVAAVVAVSLTTARSNGAVAGRSRPAAA